MCGYTRHCQAENPLIVLSRFPEPALSSPDWFEKSEWDGHHLHNFTVSEAIRLAKKCGLVLDAVHPVGHQLWLKKLNPALFCHEISFSFTR
jgi:hypothetical protein